MTPHPDDEFHDVPTTTRTGPKRAGSRSRFRSGRCRASCIRSSVATKGATVGGAYEQYVLRDE